MRKFEMEYLKTRIDSVVKCTSGKVVTKLNKKKKGTGLTKLIKYRMIKDGKAKLKSEHALQERMFRERMFDSLIECFDYPTTPEQKKKIEHNSRIQNKIDSIHDQIELKGRELIDKAIMEIISSSDIPGELVKLGEMVSLAQ